MSEWTFTMSESKSPPLSPKAMTEDSGSYTAGVVVASRAWGCSLVDSEGEPLAMSEDGTLTRTWNFAELHAQLRAAELRILHLEQTGSATLLPPLLVSDSAEVKSIYVLRLSDLLGGECRIFYSPNPCIARII